MALACSRDVSLSSLIKFLFPPSPKYLPSPLAAMRGIPNAQYCRAHLLSVRFFSHVLISPRFSPPAVSLFIVGREALSFECDLRPFSSSGPPFFVTFSLLSRSVSGGLAPIDLAN